MLYTQESRPDDYGRSTFVVEWMDGGKRRGQYFRADMVAHMQADYDRGFEVRIAKVRS